MRTYRAGRHSAISAQAFRARLWPCCAPAALIAASLFLTGCQGLGNNGDITGSIGRDAVPPSSPVELQRYTEDLGQRYAATPDNKSIALAYARALRQGERYEQAVAVMQKLAVKYPKDMAVLGAYGKALVESGRLREAETILPEAHTPEQPNWSILSAQGAVADQLGDHDQAQNYYQAALKIVPNQPQVLSNLGLSYALSKQLPQAESTLRLAAAQPGADVRVRQNLALVLSLEGKFDAAQTVAQQDLSPIDAAENVASIKQMIAQDNTWSQIRNLDTTRTAALKPAKARHIARLSHPQTPLLRNTQIGSVD